MKDKQGFFKVLRMRLTGAWWCLSRRSFIAAAGNRQEAGLVVYASHVDACIEAAFRYSASAKAQVALTNHLMNESSVAVDEANEILKQAGGKP